MKTMTRQHAILMTMLALFLRGAFALGSAGTEGASFLDIPVGADPAAMGSAYTALATNGYAPVWNPAGLASLNDNEVAGQHLAYLESINYEFLSFVHPFAADKESPLHKGIGFSAQYLGSGDITRTIADSNGNYLGDDGSFSSHYASYNLSYGQDLTERWAVGATGKWINASIDEVSANAFALDLGTMYRATDKLHLAGTITNMGTSLKFLSDGDPLPLAFHAAAAYEPMSHWLLSGEGVYERNGVGSVHFGTQWRPIEAVALRLGYKTDTLKGLSPIAGLTTGIGLDVLGSEFAYAWAPYGDLGNAQYFSLLIHFGAREEEKRNLIHYQTIKKHRTVKSNGEESGPEYQQLMQLLSDEDTHVAQSRSAGAIR